MSLFATAGLVHVHVTRMEARHTNFKSAWRVFPYMAASHQPPNGKDRTGDVSRSATVDLDLEGNALTVDATVVTTKHLEISELFEPTPDDARAEARLKTSIDPGFGWSGFEIRQGELFKVNYQQLEGEDKGRYLDDHKTTRETLVDTIRSNVEDVDVGLGYGDFAPRRPGAGF